MLIVKSDVLSEADVRELQKAIATYGKPIVPLTMLESILLLNHCTNKR